VREVARDLWLLNGLAGAFLPYAINVYLAGDILVDGATRFARGRILAQLRGRKISAVTLTHCHPDHQGVVATVCSSYGVPLYCHEADAPAMDGSGRMLPDYRFMRLAYRVVAGPPHPVARRLKDGDTVGEWRAVHTPGHTPGHVCYIRDSDRVVIAGDVLRNVNWVTGRPDLGEPPWFFSQDPAANTRSVKRLLELRPSLVCFGHGPPLTDVGMIEAFLARCERRAARFPAAQ
jgi:glyoxylase-like metal-dependent hydrolase (beta-lactamase superfamily II)